VWPQVWRQMVQVACIAGGVYLATPWGINGAALAVVGATIAMFFLTQSMMRKATGLGWLDVLEPQVPAITSSATLIAILWGVDIMVAPHSGPAVVLVVQACAAALFGLAFAWWCPFRDARELMHEVLSDWSPRAAQWIWKDVAIAPKTAKAKRAEGTAAALPSNADAGTPAVP
jgi:hypothetical protein